MAEYSVSTLRANVKALIRENQESSALADYGDVSTLSLNDLIDANIEPAAAAVYQIAPDGAWSTAVETETVANGASARTWVKIFSADVNGYTAVVDVNRRSSNYDVAKDSLNGSLGVKQRPYVLIEGNAVTVVPPGSSVKLTGVAMPAIINGKIALDTNLEDAVAYWIAYLVQMELGASNAAAYREQAMLCMGAGGGKQ